MTGIVGSNNNSRTSGIIKAVAAGVTGLTTNGTDITITSGNFIIGTAGKGIDFSNQASPAAGMDFELLDHYEEGTLGGTSANDILTDNGDITCDTYGTLSYTRIGNMCWVHGQVSITADSGGGGTATVKLPFQVASGTERETRGGGSALTNDVELGTGTSPSVLVVEGTSVATLLSSLDNASYQDYQLAVGDYIAFDFCFQTG